MLITVGIISINIAIINYVISIISTIIATARGSISTIIIIVFVFFISSQPVYNAKSI